jgi:predicted transcriptional regulator
MIVEELVQAAIQQESLEAERVRLEYEAQGVREPTGEVRILTNAARVLAAVTRDPAATMREVAKRCGQTERAVWDQLRQLESAGLLTKERQGRKNHYQVNESALIRHLLTEGSALPGTA